MEGERLAIGPRHLISDDDRAEIRRLSGHFWSGSRQPRYWTQRRSVSTSAEREELARPRKREWQSEDAVA